MPSSRFRWRVAMHSDKRTTRDDRVGGAKTFWLPMRGATLGVRCLRTGPAGQCLHFDRRGRRMLPLYDDKAASAQVEGPALRQWLAMVGGVEGREKKTRFICLRPRGSSIRVRLYGSISSRHGPGCLVMAGTLLIDPPCNQAGGARSGRIVTIDLGAKNRRVSRWNDSGPRSFHRKTLVLSRSFSPALWSST
ncbi:hypothetical protein LZ31DRAFT_135769 [Colletotrichum somersetense]|nr:hypothetical protein LZ31DRAFT_135769 [Colletotrichum somersetense]